MTHFVINENGRNQFLLGKIYRQVNFLLDKDKEFI